MTNQEATIETTFHDLPDGARVRFSQPDAGYALDELDALQVALDAARVRLEALAPVKTPVALTTMQLFGERAAAACAGGG